VRNGVLFTRRGFFLDLSNNDYLSFILTVGRVEGP
jgi:hypothetical protein